MAQYRLSLKRASRKDGRAATAMAAYRTGDIIEDRRLGIVFDYTRKGGIVHSEIVLPEGSPEWACDRNELWNRSEIADTRKDSQIAREVELSLPYEMNDDQRRDVTLEYAQYLTDRFNVAVDVSIHEPSIHGDERNHHAHLMLCTRPFDEDKKTGFGNKNRELDAIAQTMSGKITVAEEMRERWNVVLNAGLEQADIRDEEGALVVLDYRSYERQGIDQEPTVKLGVSACAIERMGETSERGKINEEIRARNDQRRESARSIEYTEKNLERLHEARELATSLTSDAQHSRSGRVLNAWLEAQQIEPPFVASDDPMLVDWQQLQQPPPEEPETELYYPDTNFDGPGF